MGAALGSCATPGVDMSANFPDMLRLAKARLADLAAASTPLGVKVVKSHCGGTEGVALCISLLRDQPPVEQDGGDGIIRDAKMVEMVKTLVEQTNNSLLNRGVIGALILSILFALPQDNLLVYRWEADDEDKRHDYEDTEFYCRVIAFLALQLSVGASLVTIPTAMLYYVQLNFYLATPELQMWYLLRFAGVRLTLQWTEHLTPIFAGVYYMFINLAISGLFGFAAILSGICPLVVFLYFNVYLLFVIDPQLVGVASKLVANPNAERTEASAQINPPDGNQSPRWV